jgi:hypothetical protein
MRAEIRARTPIWPRSQAPRKCRRKHVIRYRSPQRFGLIPRRAHPEIPLLVRGLAQERGQGPRATSSERLTECQHGDAGSEKIRSRLLRSRCYRPGSGTTSCGTKRVLKRGMVELRESALPCKIVDLSDTGAGLALSGASHVPNSSHC